MDEIDNVVDNLFGRYIAKKKDVAEIPSEPPPGGIPDLEANGGIRSSASHPDIIAKPSEPHPDIIRKPTVPKLKQQISAKTTAKTTKTAVPQKSVRKSATPATVSVDIGEIKKQTAKMLRHLSKAIKSENWWHKLYYANQFLLIAANIAKAITRRGKKS